MSALDRKAVEKAFHNETQVRHQARRTVAGYRRNIYFAAGDHFWGEVQRALDALGAKQARVLDFGCGRGADARRLVELGVTQLWGIDISEEAVDRARREVPLGRFEVMDAENLSFSDGQFDLVIGTAILHHLDLERATAEIHRVLRPGGWAIFSEPLGHNPGLNLFRRLTPLARTPFERPLLIRDVARIGRSFAGVETHEFVLTSLFLLPFLNRLSDARFDRVARAAAALDGRIWRRAPWLRRYFWITILTLRKDPVE